MASNGLNNRNTSLLALGLTLAYFAILIFDSSTVGWIKYLFGAVILICTITLAVNKEYPIQAGKFWLCVLVSLALLVALLVMQATTKFG